jgi:hypothetical protein
VQQLGPLRFQRSNEEIHAGGIAAGPVEAGDEPQRDRVVGTHEHDRYRLRSGLGVPHRRCIRDDDTNLPTNQIGR